MPNHDILAIGASAGGVEALQQICGDLPASLPASLFVVLHIPPRHESRPACCRPRSARRRELTRLAERAERQTVQVRTIIENNGEELGRFAKH